MTHGVRIHQECKAFWPFFGCAGRALSVGCWQHSTPGKEPLWHAYVPWNGKTCLPNIGISMMTLLAAAAGAAEFQSPAQQPAGDCQDGGLGVCPI